MLWLYLYYILRKKQPVYFAKLDRNLSLFAYENRHPCVHALGLVSILDKICADKTLSPFESEIHYTVRASESCGCGSKNVYDINNTL